MPTKTKAALAALLIFGSASAILADTNNQTNHHAASQLARVQLSPFCGRALTGTTMVWIKLTEPGGSPIHVNAEQIISIRSNTQILGAKAQLDLASGKFQGVQENVDQVMRLITATAGACANDERA
jgi:uncharacterized protein YlzI (FlbEa/FlbD family)